MKKDDLKKLGERAADIRRLLRMKQIEVCLDTGIKPHQLSRVEGGNSHLKFWEALALCGKYKCSLNALNWKLPLGDVNSLLPPDQPTPPDARPLPPENGEAPGAEEGDRAPIP